MVAPPNRQSGYRQERRRSWSRLAPRSALDGEIVIAREGALDFDAMQTRLHPAESRIRKLSGEIPAVMTEAQDPWTYHGLVHQWPLVAAHLDAGDVAALHGDIRYEALVWRDGRQRTLDVSLLVPGDVVALA